MDRLIAELHAEARAVIEEAAERGPELTLDERFGGFLLQEVASLQVSVELLGRRFIRFADSLPQRRRGMAHISWGLPQNLWVLARKRNRP